MNYCQYYVRQNMFHLNVNGHILLYTGVHVFLFSSLSDKIKKRWHKNTLKVTLSSNYTKI